MNSQTIYVKGRLVAYSEAGVGRETSIIFLHGFRGSYQGLLPLAEQFSDFHVVVPDLPGYGQSQPLPVTSLESYAQFVHDFIIALELHRPIIFGHSLGGSIGLAFGARFPGQAVALILAGPASYSRSAIASLGRLYYYLGRSLPKSWQPTWFVRKAPTYITSLVLMQTKDRQVRQRIINQDLANLKRLNVDVVVDSTLCYKDTDFVDLASHNVTPSLLLAGSKDRIAPPASIYRIAQEMGHADVEIIGGAGHLLAVEYPQLVAKISQSWLTDHSLAKAEVA